MSCHIEKGYKATYYRDLGYGANMEIYVAFVAIYGISGYLGLFQKLRIYHQYCCVNEEMMITNHILRRTPFSDKTTRVGSMDMFQPISWFPTVLSLRITINPPCFCHVSTCKGTPGPPPLLTQWLSPATMARVFINPGAIEATRERSTAK